MDNLLTIQEIARRSGVAASALRFYEARGLIRSVRSGAGHRRFPRAVLRRIAFIVFAQRVGIAELQRLKAGLTECIGCGCLSLDRCQFANPADRASRNGPGPRYWIGDRIPRG